MAGFKIRVSFEPEIDRGKLNAAVSAIKDVEGPKLKLGVDQSSIDATGKIKTGLKDATTEAGKLATASKSVGDNLKGASDGGAIGGLISKFKEGQAAAGQGGGLFGSLAGSLGSIASPVGAATAALAAVGGGLAKTIDIGKEFETGMQSLSAVTGLTGAPLEELGNRARDLAIKFGGDAKTQIAAFQGVLSKFGADLAGQPEQLGKVSESINLLAKAGGLDAAEAMNTLANSQLQFGANSLDAAGKAAQSAQFINVLAASARVGAAEIPQVGQAVLVAGVAAKGAKVSFEETNAAIQVLAAGGKVGAEAGTALRNVLGKLGEGRFLPKDSADGLKAAGVDMAKLSDKSIPLSARLGELKKIMSDSALVTKLFGTENASAASILVDGADTIKDWTAQMTGTDDATTQAAKNMNTFSERMSRLNAKFEDLFIGAFTKIGPILSSVLDGAAIPVLKVIGLIGAGFAAYTLVVNLNSIGIALNAAATGAWTAVVNGARAAFNLLKVAMATNPFGLLLGALTVAIGAYAAFKDSTMDAAEGQVALAQAQADSAQKQITENTVRGEGVKATKRLADEYGQLTSKTKLTGEESRRLKDLQVQLHEKYPDLIKVTDNYGGSLSAVAAIGAQTTSELDKIRQANDKLKQGLDQFNKDIIYAQRQVALTAVDDLGTGVGDTFKRALAIAGGQSGAFEKSRAQFAQLKIDLNKALYDPKATESSIINAVAAFKDAVNQQRNELGGHTLSDQFIGDSADAKAKLLSTLSDAQTKALAAVRATNNIKGDENKKADDAADAQNAKAKAAKKKHDDTEFERVKKQLADIKQEQDNQIKQIELAELRGEATAEQVAKAKLQFARQYAQEAESLLTKDGKVRIKLDKTKGETEADVNQIILDAQLAANAKSVKLKVDVEAKELDKLVLENIKDQFESLKVAVSVEALVKSGPQGVKDIQRQIDSLKLDAKEFRVNGNFEGAEDVEKKVRELETLLTANTSKAALERRQIEVDAMRDGVEKETAIKLLALDKQYADELDNANKIGQSTVDITQNYEDRKTAILKGAVGDRLGIAIAALQEEGARKVAQSVASLIKERDDLLASTTATEEQKLAIRTRFNKEINDLLSGQDDETKKKRSELEKEENDLATSFKKKEITYEEYLTKLTELKRTKQKELDDLDASRKTAQPLFPEFDTGKAGEAIGALTKTASEAVQKVPQDFGEAGQTAGLAFVAGLTTSFAGIGTLKDAGASLTDSYNDSLQGLSKSADAMSQSSINAFGELEFGGLDSFSSLSQGATASLLSIGLASKRSKDAIDGTYDLLRNSVGDKFKQMSDAVLKSMDVMKDGVLGSALDMAKGLALALTSAAVKGQSLGDALADTQQKVSAVFQKQSDVQLNNLNRSLAEAAASGKSFGDVSGSVFTQLGITVGLSFASLAASGKSGWKDYVHATFSAIKAIIPALMTLIFAQEMAQKGTFALVTAPLLIAVIQGLLTVAESAITGFKHGGHVKGMQQIIKINEDGEEFVMNNRATMRNLPAFTFINQKGMSVEEYAFKHSPDRHKYTADLTGLPTLKQIENHYHMKTEVMESELRKVNQNMEAMQTQLTALNKGVRKPGTKNETTVRVEATKDFYERERKERIRRARRGA